MLYTTAVYGPQVAIGGLAFNQGPDSNGVEWLITAETGWFSTAGVKATRTEKSSSLGVVRMMEYKGGRSIAFNGTIAAPNVGLLRRAIDQLLGLCPLPDQLYPMMVTDESGITYTAYVCIDGQILTATQSALTQTFSLQLFAPDPRKFGTQYTALINPQLSSIGGVPYPVAYPVSYGAPANTGSAVLTNLGTAYSDMVLTLNGPLTDPIILNGTTGDTLTYNGTIPSGATVVIDTAAGSVFYNGTTNYRSLLTPNEWFTIPAGSTITVALSTENTADTGTLGISYNESYY